MITTEQLMNRDASAKPKSKSGRTRSGRTSYRGWKPFMRELCRTKSSPEEVLAAVRERWPKTDMEEVQAVWDKEHAAKQ